MSIHEEPRKPREAAFFVMDESESRQTGIEGMIGVVFPVVDCTAIQHDWYREIIALQKLPERYFGMPTPIHGSKMLDDVPWADDDTRQRCYEVAVEIINRYRLRVYRCAYYTS